MKKYSKSTIALAAILAGVSAFAAGTDSLEGRWDATLTVKSNRDSVPARYFRLRS